jgi:hypothetical protein
MRELGEILVYQYNNIANAWVFGLLYVFKEAGEVKMSRTITSKEFKQISRWVILGVGTFFIYFYLREKVIEAFPNPNAQLIVGVALLLLAAYLFDITKYS